MAARDAVRCDGAEHQDGAARHYGDRVGTTLPIGDGGDKALAALPMYGGSGALPGVDLCSNAALRDVMDDDEAVGALP